MLLTKEQIISVLEVFQTQRMAEELTTAGKAVVYQSLLKFLAPSIIEHLKTASVDHLPTNNNPHDFAQPKFVTGLTSLPRTATSIPPFPIDKTDAWEEKQDLSRFDRTA